jgi:uncharacterized protein (DUF1778 family)
MVRPKKAERDVKEETIRIRVTEEQKHALIDAAKREGLDVSTWLRFLGLRAAAGRS